MSLLRFLEERASMLKTLYQNVPFDDTYKSSSPEISMERMIKERDWKAFQILIEHFKDYRTPCFQYNLFEHYLQMRTLLPELPEEVYRQFSWIYPSN